MAQNENEIKVECPQCESLGIDCAHTNNVKAMLSIQFTLYSNSRMNREECLRLAAVLVPTRS